MTTNAPDYPGYKSPCNGCGLCCLTAPCAVSREFGLWRKGKCAALRQAAGRYWCDAIVNPRRVSVELSKIPKAKRIDAIGINTLCDSRHATSKRGALRLLQERNAQDEYFDESQNTYPRAAVWHRRDGRDLQFVKMSADQAPIMRPAPNQTKEGI